MSRFGRVALALVGARAGEFWVGPCVALELERVWGVM